MIRHICMFKIKPEGREEKVAEFLRRAESLRAIGEIRRFEAVANYPGTPDSNFDVALIFDFDSLEALDSYQKHPMHVEFGRFVATVRELRACIDYKL